MTRCRLRPALAALAALALSARPAPAAAEGYTYRFAVDGYASSFDTTLQSNLGPWHNARSNMTVR